MGLHRGPTVVTNGLVLYLDAANPKSYPKSGTMWNDLSGNNNNGTLINGPTFDSGNGGSIQFDGVNDRWISNNSIPSINFQFNGEFTINTWCYINENTNVGYITSYRLTDGNNVQYSGWGLSQNNGRIVGTVGGYPSFTFAWRRVETSTTDFNNLVFQKWSNIVYVNTGIIGEQKIYINGKNSTESTIDQRTPPYTVNYTTNHRLIIGHDIDNEHPLNGNISHVSVYNRALTPSEILQNYNTIKGRYNL
jgi:hypothetical protein